jgi:uncharacterized protein YgbK (DUF1537 family)
MQEKYLIVADDFTGANDTGVQLRRRGFTSGVVFAGKRAALQTDCAVIDTESRGLTPEAAAAAVSDSLRDVDFGAYRYVIKKVDSTLRGNIAAEVKAMDAAFAPELILFAPALPDLGRTTVGGIHHLKGTRITHTELARDPKKPVTEDNINALLRQVYAEEVRHFDLSCVRGGHFDLSGCRVFTCDAETNEDMRAAIRAALATGRRVLWVGTAAMADNIIALDRQSLPAFGAVASLSDVTAQQVAAAQESGVTVVSVPFHLLLSGQADGESYVRRCAESLAAGYDTLLVSSTTLCRDDLDKTRASGAVCGLDATQVSEYVQRACGELAVEVLLRQKVSGVFLTGGDTAMGVLSALGAQGSEILSEILVGLPMMRLVGGRAHGLKAVTKAGAFGGRDAISFALRKLKEE